MLQAELIRPSNPRWAETLAETRHDFYHLPRYTEFCTSHMDAGNPVAFLAQEGDQRFFVPLILRDIPGPAESDGGLIDGTSIRGYPGPIVGGAVGLGESDFIERALSALKETLRSAGVVSAFIRLHPLFTLPSDVLARHGTVVDHGDSVAIDLGESETEMWRMTRHGHRGDINKAKRLGLVVRIDEHWERLDDLVLAYDQSMTRIGATDRWRLSRSYFSDLRDALGAGAHLCVVEDGERLCAAAVLTEVDGIVEYHLAGTMDDYVGMSPSKSIIDFARRWAKDRGDRVFHLAGSISRGDPLIKFKLGFSPLLHPVLSWRIISDVAAYDELTRAWCEREGIDADTPDGFFPAYRKPGVARPGPVGDDGDSFGPGQTR